MNDHKHYHGHHRQNKYSHCGRTHRRPNWMMSIKRLPVSSSQKCCKLSWEIKIRSGILRLCILINTQVGKFQQNFNFCLVPFSKLVTWKHKVPKRPLYGLSYTNLTLLNKQRPSGWGGHPERRIKILYAWVKICQTVLLYYFDSPPLGRRLSKLL